MAYQAAALLDRMMMGRRPPAKPIRIPPNGLVTRRSTDIVALKSLPVAKALRFVADQYPNPLLSVKDVVGASGISRRPLEKLFRHELQRTINEEIMRVRLGKARHLLESTRMKIIEISAATGFTRSNHLFRCFRQQLALTPRAYRARGNGETKKIG